MLKKKKKIRYSSKKYSNPFFQSKRKKRFYNTKPTFTWQIKLIFASAFLAIIVIVWFFYFCSYFKIENINVFGSIKISTNEIESLAWQQTNKKRFFVVPQKNINAFNKKELENLLMEKYYFEILTIEKDFPNSININIKEKNYSLIWYETDNYYYIDNLGFIIAGADPLEIKQNDYPLIDNRSGNNVSGKKTGASESDINYIIELFKEFKENHKNYKVDRFILDDKINTVSVALIDGPDIYFNVENNINDQINKLLVIINEKLKDSFMDKEYIDLRYGDRVYYR